MNKARLANILPFLAVLTACDGKDDLCSTPSPEQQPEGPTVPIEGQDIIQSAGALAFGDGGVLFVGDSEAGLVHAFDFPQGTFDDQSDYVLGRASTFEGRNLVKNIDAQLASILGIPVEEVMINDLVMHPGTKQLVLSVHRGTGPDAAALLFKVNRGALELLNFKQAPHSSIDVGTVSPEAQLEFGQKIQAFAVTDIEYYDGEIFVAGVSGDDFSSTIRRSVYPFEGPASLTRTEIWHAVHAQFETRSPILTHHIQELDGVPYLIAVYACTPLVRFALSELVDGARVRGDMIAELGFGNTPVDMITYVDPFLQQPVYLVTHTHRSATRFLVNDVATAEPLPYEAPNVFDQAGVPVFDIPMVGAEQMVQIDETWVAVIEEDPLNPGALQLRTVALPFFFDRSDHLVEMNFPGAPDPFGYRNAPPKGFDD